MKVKALVKAAYNSNKMNFGNKLDDKFIILIDGCFTPMFKAKEDKRKVDTFYVVKHKSQVELNVNTVYIKESIVHPISKKKIEKDVEKHKEKDKKKNKTK